MNLTRRSALAIGAGAIVVTMLPLGARADLSDDAQALVDEFAGGAELSEGGVTLTAPEIAENGNTVPISVDAPGAESILVLALGNPVPGVAEFKFGPLAGAQKASTRIRLMETQDLLVLAKMDDGSVKTARAEVKVTIGGCGG
ncbi:MAG: thiosulfate oxidation carrier protein SoxY [Paracoccus sp. (in: a-proteobacteria)]|nr:thiosulfate oxidation carrier protein SoxY [Paracoccus sp. (in: a-proteobacteria)]